jgi:hypothetical protein
MRNVEFNVYRLRATESSPDILDYHRHIEGCAIMMPQPARLAWFCAVASLRSLAARDAIASLRSLAIGSG